MTQAGRPEVEDRRRRSGTEAAGVSELGVLKSLISLKAQVRRCTPFLFTLCEMSAVDDLTVHTFIERVWWERG